MTTLFVLTALILTTWLYMSYLSWKHSSGTTFEPIERSDLIKQWAKLVRLVRRGWYGASIQSKQALSWSGKKAEHAFVTVFPKSAVAFTKHDELTGLETGPSSYFLKRISTDPKKRSRSPRTKKVV
jgi:hypothetical protein